MRLAVIPARGGSKRIPKKNIAPFCGKPMMAYAIEAAAGSGAFDKIHISTDAPEIAEAAAVLGYKPDFMRTPDLADDFTGLVPVLRWVVEQYRQRGEVYDEICCIMPNAPLIRSDDISADSKFLPHTRVAIHYLYSPAFPCLSNGYFVRLSPALWGL